MLFGHGDDIGYNRVLEGNFSSNVWYGGYLEQLKPVILASVSRIASYPEPDARSLRQLLANTNEVNVDNVMVTNGAIEAIYLIAQAWQGCWSSIVTPSFSEYEDACRLYNHHLEFMDGDEFDEISRFGTEMCWLCNPNNPIGKVRTRQELLELIGENPNTLFVIDQSYAGFYDGLLLNASDILQFSNLLLINSLTKCYSIPGIRVGYIIASSGSIEKLLSHRIPWSVNALAIEVAKHIVANASDFRLPLGEWLEQKQRLVNRLESIGNLEIMPSEMPFFLARLLNGTASDLKSYLLENHALLIRDASNFRGLTNDYIRISSQDDATNNKLISAIKRWNTTR